MNGMRNGSRLRAGGSMIRTAKIERLMKKASVLYASLMTTLMMSVVNSYAAETTQSVIEEGIKDGALQIYEIMVAVIVPIAAVVFVWTAFKMIFGTSRDSAETKKNVITIVITLALVFLGPLIIEEVAGWFSSLDATSVFK